ncbi:MAG TPA: hypothetical protein VKE51_08350 [Vicinamibacterales bacterium]|nr:hypothetical protein [Vicinamibacterales bacterium]
MCLAIGAAACAPRLTKLPSGRGTPSPDFAQALVDARAACERVQSLTAEIAVTGSVAGQRTRAHLVAGFAPAAGRIEAVAPFGAPLFIFVASGADGTLYFPREDRVVEHGRPAELLEAVAGVPLASRDLLRTMTGCAIPEPLGSAQAIGENWRTSAGEGGAKIYLRRETSSAPWRLVAVFHPGAGAQWSWRADYDAFQNGLPTVIRLVSAERDRFNIQLMLSQIETNVPLGPDTFRVEVPSTAERIGVEQLRRSGSVAPAKTRSR